MNDYFIYDVIVDGTWLRFSCRLHFFWYYGRLLTVLLSDSAIQFIDKINHPFVDSINNVRDISIIHFVCFISRFQSMKWTKSKSLFFSRILLLNASHNNVECRVVCLFTFQYVACVCFFRTKFLWYPIHHRQNNHINLYWNQRKLFSFRALQHFHLIMFNKSSFNCI